MAIFPPEEKIWWRERVAKTEVLWVTLALVWALVMFFMMPYWHFAGDQNLSNEAYRITPEAFAEKAEAFAEKHTVRTDEASDMPVVAPPAGSDVYMLGRTFEWWPILELKQGETYRLHLSSMDLQHGWSLLPENINIQVHPYYDMVVTITPTTAGEFSVVCNEYCGLGHHQMVGKIFVK